MTETLLIGAVGLLAVAVWLQACGARSVSTPGSTRGWWPWKRGVTPRKPSRIG